MITDFIKQKDIVGDKIFIHIELPKRILSTDAIIVVLKEDILKQIRKTHSNVIQLSGPVKLTNRSTKDNCSFTYVATLQVETPKKKKTTTRRRTRKKLDRLKKE